jgi:hypothetical protein
MIRTREGKQIIHLDRVSKCSVDLPSVVEWALAPETSRKLLAAPVEPDDSFVIDRLLSHARATNDSCWLIRVRLAAFGSVEYTWEPATELPVEMVTRYERRKRLPAGMLTQN